MQICSGKQAEMSLNMFNALICPNVLICAASQVLRNLLSTKLCSARNLTVLKRILRIIII